MSRIRTIKPEFPQSESMGRVSRDARLLFVLLWTICDDEGRTRAASRMLASLLFPYDEDAASLIERWLAELERERCVIRYITNGAHYLQVCNWLNHQKIDRPSKSKIPALANPRESSRILDADLDLDQGPVPVPVERESARARVDLPVGVDPQKWQAFHDQLSHDGKESAPRILLATGQLKAIAKAGGDCNAVLEAAVMRGMRDLADVHRQLVERCAPTARTVPQPIGKQVQALATLQRMRDEIRNG